jgi:hypothetical protein
VIVSSRKGKTWRGDAATHPPDLSRPARIARTAGRGQVGLVLLAFKRSSPPVLQLALASFRRMGRSKGCRRAMAGPEPSGALLHDRRKGFFNSDRPQQCRPSVRSCKPATLHSPEGIWAEVEPGLRNRATLGLGAVEVELDVVFERREGGRSLNESLVGCPSLLAGRRQQWRR